MLLAQHPTWPASWSLVIILISMCKRAHNAVPLPGAVQAPTPEHSTHLALCTAHNQPCILAPYTTSCTAAWGYAGTQTCAQHPPCPASLMRRTWSCRPELRRHPAHAPRAGGSRQPPQPSQLKHPEPGIRPWPQSPAYSREGGGAFLCVLRAHSPLATKSCLLQRGLCVLWDECNPLILAT